MVTFFKKVGIVAAVASITFIPWGFSEHSKDVDLMRALQEDSSQEDVVSTIKSVLNLAVQLIAQDQENSKNQTPEQQKLTKHMVKVLHTFSTNLLDILKTQDLYDNPIALSPVLEEVNKVPTKKEQRFLMRKILGDSRKKREYIEQSNLLLDHCLGKGSMHKPKDATQVSPTSAGITHHHTGSGARKAVLGMLFSQLLVPVVQQVVSYVLQYFMPMPVEQNLTPVQPVPVLPPATIPVAKDIS
jgi:hypothetical protein